MIQKITFPSDLLESSKKWQLFQPLTELASSTFFKLLFASPRFPSPPALRFASFRFPAFASLPFASLPFASHPFASLRFASLRFPSLPSPSSTFFNLLQPSILEVLTPIDRQFETKKKPPNPERRTTRPTDPLYKKIWVVGLVRSAITN